MPCFSPCGIRTSAGDSIRPWHRVSPFDGRAMDVFEAVDSRISCRWFLDKPVAPDIVHALIVRAARAASGGNLQPWYVYALAGTPLIELERRVALAIDGRDPRHDEAEYPIY